jgi:hypothetical protein
MFAIIYLNSASLDVRGARIQSAPESIDCFSVYDPRGVSTLEELQYLFTSPNPLIIAGDFNVHNTLWESNVSANHARQSIHDLLVDHPDATILTPKDLGIRFDPGTGKVSTIHLLITSLLYALNSTIKEGPSTGSDHLPIISTIDANPVRLSKSFPSWIFPKN